MPVICFGPVCVPLNLFLPFLVGLLHRYGYLQWFKREWVTFVYWKLAFYRRMGWQTPVGARPFGGPAVSLDPAAARDPAMPIPAAAAPPESVQCLADEGATVGARPYLKKR